MSLDATVFTPIPEDAEEIGVSAWFARLVEREPDAIAIKDTHGALTRAQLEARTRVLASLLAATTDAGAATPLLLPHGAAMLAGLLGTLRAGGLCVPLDLTHPPARLGGIIDAIEPRVIVTDEAHRPLVVELGRGRLRVITLEEAAATRGDSDRKASFDPDQPAYMLFTSGSSGPPKGIVHSQRSLVHRARSFVNHLRIGAGDRLTLFAIAATGQGIHNALTGLTAGARLVAHAPRENGLAAIPALLRQERITITNSSATLFRTLVQILRPDDVFPDVRVVRVGGERVRYGDVLLARKHFPNARFVNLFSSTETAAITIHCIDPHDALPDGDEVPVGKSLPGYTVRVVGDDGRELPRGQEGEIVVRSRYMATGYWRDAERTAAVFRDAEPGGERSYYSRDRGRMRADGTLEHLGRLDSRVKIRGHRVELGEVERIIATHPAVRQAAVFVTQAADGEDQLVACVSGEASAQITPAELRAFLTGVLPHQILPTVIAWLPQLPMTVSGKIDRNALKRRRGDWSPAAAAEATAATEMEHEVMALWREVLGATQVGLTDDFLTIGGDSLRAGRLLARVLDRWDVDISFAEFLEHPTIAGLARTIGSRMASPGS